MIDLVSLRELFGQFHMEGLPKPQISLTVIISVAGHLATAGSERSSTSGDTSGTSTRMDSTRTLAFLEVPSDGS
jgi:hypothetical protein